MTNRRALALSVRVVVRCLVVAGVMVLAACELDVPGETGTTTQDGTEEAVESDGPVPGVDVGGALMEVSGDLDGTYTLTRWTSSRRSHDRVIQDGDYHLSLRFSPQPRLEVVGHVYDPDTPTGHDRGEGLLVALSIERMMFESTDGECTVTVEQRREFGTTDPTIGTVTCRDLEGGLGDDRRTIDVDVRFMVTYEDRTG